MIFINIGSNLCSSKGDRLYNLKKSIDLIKKQKIKILKTSSVKSKKTPVTLIKTFQVIEKKLQRNRGLKNQPRTCDIDIIDYYGKIINTSIINLPHPRSHLRNFVLYPLSEISPNWKHPALNQTIEFLIKRLNFKLRNEITRLNESVIIDL